jgi:hypothetical protein
MIGCGHGRAGAMLRWLTIESIGNKENLARRIYVIRYRAFAATGHPIGIWLEVSLRWGRERVRKECRCLLQH